MNRQFTHSGLGLIVLALSSAPAFAHHVMGGRTPATFGEGILSGLGHPVIGVDHFAAVVAIGCLAATHRAASALVVAFMLAMMAGVTLHLHGATVPGAEILVALTVIALGALMLRHQQMPAGAALVLFAMVGIIQVMRSANRFTALSRHRSTPICLALRPFKARSRLVRRRSHAALRNDRLICRRFDLSAPALPVSGWLS
jgi:hydrogenase/urease accessory protein HupE